MANILIAIFNMSIAGSVVIFLALLTRLFLQRFFLKYTYVLWGIVCLRLLCPFGINSPALFNFFQGKGIGRIISRTEYIPQPIGGALFQTKITFENTSFINYILTVLFIIWFVGFIGMLLYEIIACNNAKRRLATAIKIQERVFETDQISMPFVFGFFNPKIYVPIGMDEKELPYILCHEFVHIQRKDYLIKLFYCFVLAFHWFNPFVWLAFKHMNLDMEMNCDEKVVDSLGDNIRKDYAEIIYNLSQVKIKITKSILMFGESDTHIRVANLLNNKKDTAVKKVAAVIICTILIIGIISNSMITAMFDFIHVNLYERDVMQLKSTDLSVVTIDNIGIGSYIKDIDMSAYKKSNRFNDGDYAYYFDHLMLDVDDSNRVSYVFGYNSEVSIDFNEKTAFTIDEITNFLGGNYLDVIKDKKQRLRKRVYYDNIENMIAEFVYVEHNGEFIMAMLKKIT